MQEFLTEMFKEDYTFFGSVSISTEHSPTFVLHFYKKEPKKVFIDEIINDENDNADIYMLDP